MPQLCTITAGRPESLTSVLMASLALLCLALPSPALSSTTESTATQIDTALTEQTWARLHQRYPDLADDRVRIDFDLPSAVSSLAPCPDPIDIDWRGQTLAGRQTPKVSCDTLGWQLYIPIDLAIHRPVVVAAGSLSRGHRLTASDLTLRTLDIGTLRLGYFDSIDSLEGYEVARPVQPGDVITPHMAEPPVMVKRGDRVVIIATTGGGLSVRTLGEALRDGPSGEQIPVRNLTSRKVVHAYVKSKGVVEIAVQ
ncbi:flagellar basal body P-ring formation chaperone FlgA [Saccharospirillum salsuginis]|uniref:Flagella basal body P-ring formation protein FlgA n=1 Tax=Saccharospirillum salsuginis TaxID=418750 RepID=A0A918N924_9GAMM|nr:flagellar basal body P-ring formation chaperone FlgA [Saccharospirillum salsuginis]GGX50447.1 hypothetical protein GCM10007392_17000 [Saccharospirillum salsuginis]